MKTENDKIKLSITLDEYESELLREATKIALPGSPCVSTDQQDRRRLVKLALISFFRAVINTNGRITYPVMAELRYCELEDIEPADFLKAKSRK